MLVKTERRLGSPSMSRLPCDAPLKRAVVLGTLFLAGLRRYADDGASAEVRGRPMRVGFIGTGTMGTPIAGCLVAAGHQVTVYDIRREATETLQQQGAAVGETPRALAEASEVVFTSLPGPNEVEAAALDPETGLPAGLADSGAYIDLTTNAPE